MVGTESLSLLLGFVSIVLGSVALWLTLRNDKLVKALSNLEFDEKRAVISGYCQNVEAGRAADEDLRLMEANVSALAHLVSYVDEDKRERLVRGDLLPALQRLAGQQPVPKQGAVQAMVDEALKFGVCKDALKQLQIDLAKS